MICAAVTPLHLIPERRFLPELDPTPESMRTLFAVAFAVCVTAAALAQEPVGCDKFKFELGAAPFTVQISSVEADHIAIAVTPAPD
jgi:hypothetical protein